MTEHVCVHTHTHTHANTFAKVEFQFTWMPHFLNILDNRAIIEAPQKIRNGQDDAQGKVYADCM